MRSSLNFFHISHNLTWYSAIVHKFTRIYPVCSTYELTKQFIEICVKNCAIDPKMNNLYPSTYLAHSPVIWDILEKKRSSSHVHCPCTWQNFRCEKVCCVPPKVSSVLGTFGRHDVHHLIANFFMFKIGKNLQVAKSSVQYPWLLMWEDARKKSEKSLDEETIECVFGNRIFWLDMARLFCQTFEIKVLVGCKNWKQKGFLLLSNE